MKLQRLLRQKTLITVGFVCLEQIKQNFIASECITTSDKQLKLLHKWWESRNSAATLLPPEKYKPGISLDSDFAYAVFMSLWDDRPPTEFYKPLNAFSSTSNSVSTK